MVLSCFALSGLMYQRSNRSQGVTAVTDSGRMPWADLFGPFRTKSEERESWLDFRQ
jgi:hypothetical protein